MLDKRDKQFNELKPKLAEEVRKQEDNIMK